MTKSTNSVYLSFICMIATMGGLMFGFDISIISGAVALIQPYFGWNELQLGWGVSSLLVGATTFLFLALMSALQWLFTYLYVPETKGKSLEEIELHWAKLYESGINKQG